MVSGPAERVAAAIAEPEGDEKGQIIILQQRQATNLPRSSNSQNVSKERVIEP